MLRPTTSERRVAEEALGGARKRIDDAVIVDDDHRIGDGVENELEVRLARQKAAVALRLRAAGALQLRAEPDDPQRHDKESGIADEIFRRQPCTAIDQQRPQPTRLRPAVARPGPTPPADGDNQNRRDEQDQHRRVADQRRQRQPHAERHENRHTGAEDRPRSAPGREMPRRIPLIRLPDAPP